MNLSRAAKKFRTSDYTPRPVTPKKPLPEPVIESPVVEVVAPVVEPVAVEPVAVEPAAPTGWPVKPKRTRFVREQGEKRERVNLPPLPASPKFFARLMTQNLAVPPNDEAKPGRYQEHA